jgi:hypothetical protein
MMFSPSTNRKLLLLLLIGLQNRQSRFLSFFNHFCTMGSTCSSCERLSEGITFGPSDKSKDGSRRSRNIYGSTRDLPRKTEPPDNPRTRHCALNRWSEALMFNTSNLATTHAASRAAPRKTNSRPRVSNPLARTVYHGSLSPGVVAERGQIPAVTAFPLSYHKREPPDNLNQSATQPVQCTPHEVDTPIPDSGRQAYVGCVVLHQQILFCPPLHDAEQERCHVLFATRQQRS